MVQNIADKSAEVSSRERSRDRLISQLIQNEIKHQGVLEAMARVPRHLFVEPGLEHQAYNDVTLPIGKGQTISQPYIVALMSQAAFSGFSAENVLEIGTGCGYQTAILAQLAKRVCTIERIGSLQQQAEQRLRGLGFRNIEYRHGDGFIGWRERAPFDAIVVTAGAESIPEMLPQQLGRGGRLVIPVGPDSNQRLVVLKKQGDSFVEESNEQVRFVPLLRGMLE